VYVWTWVIKIQPMHYNTKWYSIGEQDMHTNWTESKHLVMMGENALECQVVYSSMYMVRGGWANPTLSKVSVLNQITEPSSNLQMLYACLILHNNIINSRHPLYSLSVSECWSSRNTQYASRAGIKQVTKQTAVRLASRAVHSYRIMHLPLKGKPC
jgi:hypothetical protein